MIFFPYSLWVVNTYTLKFCNSWWFASYEMHFHIETPGHIWEMHRGNYVHCRKQSGKHLCLARTDFHGLGSDVGRRHVLHEQPKMVNWLSALESDH